MNRRPYRTFVLLLPAWLTACSAIAPAPTATPPPTIAPTFTATALPSATSTPVPTATRTPAPTYEPAPAHDAAIVESILREKGYKRYPIGENAWFWDNGTGVVFETYSFGLEARFLNDPGDQAGRLQRIDKALEILAPLFTRQFLADVQQEAHGFAGRTITVTGDPVILDYGNGGSVGKLMQFNAYDTSIRNGPVVLPVEMSLLFREYHCEDGYYCYFSDMPTMTFTGGATLTFFDIWIDYRAN